MISFWWEAWNFYVRFKEVNFFVTKWFRTERSVRYPELRGSSLLRLKIEKKFESDFGTEKECLVKREFRFNEGPVWGGGGSTVFH